MRDRDYEPEHYRCRDCKFYHNNCKRVDNDKVKFWKPWHQADDRQSANIVCRDFVLKDYLLYARKNWIDFDTYWSEFVECWLPYKNTNILVYFTVDGDDAMLGVPLMDFVNGNMYDADGNLKYVERKYYKRTKDGFGYKLVRESVNNE